MRFGEPWLRGQR